MNRRRGLGWSIVFAFSGAISLSASCRGDDPAAAAGAHSIALLYPAAGPLLEATGQRPVDDGSAYALRTAAPSQPAVSGAWTSSVRALELRIDKDDPSSRVLSSAHGTLGIRRLGGGTPSVRMERDSLVLGQPSSAVDSVFVPRDEGIEELVQVDSTQRHLEYAIDLPAGWRLRAPKGYPDVIEVVDAHGVARLRARSHRAWDSEGRELAIRATVHDNTMRLAIPETTAEKVLVDPLWQDAGEVMTVRRGARAALLPSGRVGIFGGALLYGGDATSMAELFDPRTSTFTLAAPLQQARIDHMTVVLNNGRVLIAGGFQAQVQSTEGESVDLTALETVEQYDPVTNTTSMAGAMTAPRGQASATVLPDGNVLIAGGTTDGTTLASAELYDPTTGTFTTLPSMPSARQDHAATLLADGRVLLSGGTDGSGSLATTVLYDSGSFTPGPTMADHRFGHLVVPLPDGRILFAGGKQTSPSDPPELEDQDVLTSAEILDLQAGTFEPVDGATCAEGTQGELWSGRFRAAATLLPNGQVLIAAGQVSVSGAPVEYHSKTAELFDPDTLCFAAVAPSVYPTLSPSMTVLPSGKVILTGRSPGAQIFDATSLVGGALTSVPLPTPASQGTATLLATGEVLFAGGQDALVTLVPGASVYRPDTDDFAPVGDLQQPRTLHTATRLFDGTVLLAGGGDTSATIFDSAELFDPTTGQFEMVGAMSSPRAAHTATLLPDGRVLVVGGLTTLGSVTESVDVYDPATKSFTPGPALQVGRAQHATALLTTGQVLVTGGTEQYANGQLFTSAEIIDLAGGVSVEIAPMKEGRLGHVAAPLPDGRVLLAAGAPTTSCEIFDPTTSAFSFVGSMPEPRFSPTAVHLPSGNIAILGGTRGGGATADRTVPIFDPGSESWSLAIDASGDVVTLARDHVLSSATVLPDGSAMVFGGFSHEVQPNGMSLDVVDPIAERFAEDLPAPLDSVRPHLEVGPSLPAPGATENVSGASFTGFGETSGGTYAANNRFPVALWIPLNGAFELGTFIEWSDTSAKWLIPAPRYPGPGLLFAVTNGLRSNGLAMTLPPADSGVPCTTDSQCQSGFCTDGFCCDQRCDAACVACSADMKGEGADGACGPIVAGQDPKDLCTELDVCSDTGSCDGAGMCQTCAPPTTCNGDSILVAGDVEVRDCAPFKCSTEKNQCLTTCTAVSDCVSGLVCDASGACVAPPADDGGDACSYRGLRGSSPYPSALILLMGLLGAARRRGRR
jgi:hypothetical protein